jgi:hypothetical protein
MNLKLKRFEPGTYVELTDTIKGFRKLCLVTGAGDMYFDLADLGSTPFPIYEVSVPVDVGNTLSWSLALADKDPERHRAFTSLHAYLVSTKVDSITLARALRWAIVNANFEPRQAFAAGTAETARVRGSRDMIDRVAARASAA